MTGHTGLRLLFLTANSVNILLMAAMKARLRCRGDLPMITHFLMCSELELHSGFGKMIDRAAECIVQLRIWQA